MRFVQHIGLKLEELTQDHLDRIFDVYRGLGLPTLEGANVTPASIRSGINPMLLAEGIWGTQLTPEPDDAPQNKLYIQSGKIPGLVHVGIYVKDDYLHQRFVAEIKRNFL